MTKQRVLLIEDDPTMLSLLKILLEMENFIVDVFEGKELSDLIQQITATPADIILMDVYMHYFNGLDALAAIRASAVHQPGIIMTSGMDLEDKCLAMGADAFIMKPYMPDTLVKIIKEQASPEA
ncbi:MAG TPA: response regulator [Anaerolineaceae bacterium]|nr:response regulator [Anaerolineaceae bacterium]HPN50798.1 response regulator [Anaerolineaceae bacterium]